MKKSKTLNSNNIGDLPLMSWDVCKAKFHRIKRLQQEIDESDNPKLTAVNQETIAGIRRQIILGNTRLVVTIAKKIDPENFREAFSAGAEALIRATSAFNVCYKSDKTDEIRFSTYACNAMFRAIHTWQSDQHLVLSQNAISRMSAYNRACDALATKNNYRPSLDDIRDQLIELAPPSMVRHWSLKNVELAARSVSNYRLERIDYQSQNDEVKRGNNSNHPAYLEDTSISIDRGDMLETVLGHQKMTLDQIGAAIGVSKERVRQIIEDASVRIKKQLAVQT